MGGRKHKDLFDVDPWSGPEAILPTRDGRGLVAFSARALSLLSRWHSLTPEEQKQADQEIRSQVQRVHLDD